MLALLAKRDAIRMAKSDKAFTKEARAKRKDYAMFRKLNQMLEDQGDDYESGAQ